MEISYASGAPGPSTAAVAAPSCPPPYYMPSEAMEVPLLCKAEPMAAECYPQQQLPPPPYTSPAGPLPPPQPMTLTANTQQVIVLQPTLGIEPAAFMCVTCQQFVTTRVRLENGGFAWLLCAGMCLLGCNLGCCFIPFCMKSCKDAVHECPNCNTVLHHYKRL